MKELEFDDIKTDKFYLATVNFLGKYYADYMSNTYMLPSIYPTLSHVDKSAFADKKEYSKLLSDLKIWEISGGYLSQEDILKIEPDFHKIWKDVQSNGNSQYDFFVRQIEVYGNGEKPYYSYVHNQAVMIIEDKERDVYKLHLSVAIDVPKYFKQDIKIHYEIGRPAEKSKLFYHPVRF